MNEFSDINSNVNIESIKTDWFVTRLFKSESDYIKEGCIICSEKYCKVITELTIAFKEIKTQLSYTSQEKQQLIDALLEILKKLEDYEQNEKRDNIIRLCVDCIKVFEDDIKCSSMEETNSIAFDNSFSDWRNVYGFIEKDGNKI